MPLAGRGEQFVGSTVQSLVESALLGVSSRMKLGTNVFSREWDLLIVLDTCRVDALEEVAPEFDFVPASIPSIWSVGSATREWVGNTFVESYQDEINETALVSANQSPSWGLWSDKFGAHPPLARRLTEWNTVDENTPLSHDPVWQSAPTDPWTGLTLPSCTTDRAVTVGRTDRPDRCLVHYMPPHSPYRARAISQNRPLREIEQNPWEALQQGADSERVWELYLDELRWVLNSVDRLLSNYDADRAVITADHGELFGEWGLYSHPSGVPHPKLRKVPWVETTATDTKTYEPQLDPPDEREDIEKRLVEQLEQLGYR